MTYFVEENENFIALINFVFLHNACLEWGYVAFLAH